jgi:hypothetical protein
MPQVDSEDEAMTVVTIWLNHRRRPGKENTLSHRTIARLIV